MIFRMIEHVCERHHDTWFLTVYVGSEKPTGQQHPCFHELVEPMFRKFWYFVADAIINGFNFLNISFNDFYKHAAFKNVPVFLMFDKKYWELIKIFRQKLKVVFEKLLFILRICHFRQEKGSWGSDARIFVYLLIFVCEFVTKLFCKLRIFFTFGTYNHRRRNPNDQISFFQVLSSIKASVVLRLMPYFNLVNKCILIFHFLNHSLKRRVNILNLVSFFFLQLWSCNLPNLWLYLLHKLSQVITLRD